MDFILIILLAALCLAIFVSSLTGPPDTIYKLPFLTSAVTLGWYLPQVVSIAMFKGPEQYPGFGEALTMSILCMLAIWVGYLPASVPAARRYTRPPDTLFDIDRLQYGALFLAIIGFFFRFRVAGLASSAGTQWSGAITIYFFFFQALNYAYVLSLLCVLKRPNFLGLSIFAFTLILKFESVLVARRAETIKLFLVVALALWFHRRIAASKALTVTLIVAASVAVLGVGDLRRTIISTDEAGQRSVSGLSLEAIQQVDFLRAAEIYLRYSSHEARNQIILSDHVAEHGLFTYGLNYWNYYVFRYVPAQIVGPETKLAMMSDYGIVPRSTPFYDSVPGSTTTGFYDAYAAFWFFGCLVFFVISRIMRNLYDHAMVGNLLHQSLYCVLILEGMQSVTHSTEWFFAPIPQIALFFGPIFVWAYIRPQSNRVQGRRAAAPKPDANRQVPVASIGD